MRFACALLLFGCAASLVAQDRRDFLTADEADQVRLAQDPNERLKLYAKFAAQRVEMVRQLVEQSRPGRSQLIHDTLEDYSNILDAIDTVADDALGRKLEIGEGMKAVAAADKEMLPKLQKIADSRPKDLTLYEFMLTQAIETTQDSLSSANEDLGGRAQEVAAKEARDKKELESMMQPKDLEAKRAAEKKAAAETNKRKPPTLLRKGEKIKQR